jgi:SAM-dependent methyltransferase
VSDVQDPGSGEIAYSRMRWNTPLSEEHSDLLLDRLECQMVDELLDLGCGWGELLLRGLTRSQKSRGVGVDNSDWALDRARAAAADRGLVERVRFVAHDAAVWRESAERVLCIGASHAWGGGAEALRGLTDVVRPGGRLLFGDGYWQQPPTVAAVEMFGEGISTLSALAESAIEAGWRVLHLSTADQREWDDFESTWRAGREQWLLANPSDFRSSQVKAEMESRLRDYLTVYRGVLGFAYLVLTR